MQSHAQSAWTELLCYLSNNVPRGGANALREARRKVSAYCVNLPNFLDLREAMTESLPNCVEPFSHVLLPPETW